MICFYDGPAGDNLPDHVRAPNPPAAAKAFAELGYEGRIRFDDEQGVSHVFKVATVKVSYAYPIESWGWPNG